LRDGRNDTQLIRESANVFQQWNDPSFKLEFTQDPDSSMKVTAYHTSHAPYSLTKLKPDFSGFDFKKLNGSYINEESNVRCEITHIEGQNYRIQLSDRDYAGLLLKPDLLKVNSYMIHFKNDNKADELILDGDRIKGVLFKSAK
jgi:hypothetical protein